MFPQFFFENRIIYEITWKNIVEADRPQMTTVMTLKFKETRILETTVTFYQANWCHIIQGVYKRMVRFQKIRNLLLTLHGHNLHRQQRKLSKFLMRYQQFASHA